MVMAAVNSVTGCTQNDAFRLAVWQKGAQQADFFNEKWRFSSRIEFSFSGMTVAF